MEFLWIAIILVILAVIILLVVVLTDSRVRVTSSNLIVGNPSFDGQGSIAFTPRYSNGNPLSEVAVKRQFFTDRRFQIDGVSGYFTVVETRSTLVIAKPSSMTNVDELVGKSINF